MTFGPCFSVGLHLALFYFPFPWAGSHESSAPDQADLLVVDPEDGFDSLPREAN